ncbi:unnamed protein product [Brassica rapa subsp. narinosa]|uniref:Uncharacterized protein n=1 Tax=Brassica campestris TaxID=3711 RepID=M4EN41_BRACM
MYSRFVDLVIEGEIINRNVCQNRFVEEINEMPDQTASESNVEDDNGENSDGEFDLEEIMISY